MPFVVIYDACVLYPASLRDFLLRVAREAAEDLRKKLLRSSARKRPILAGVR